MHPMLAPGARVLWRDSGTAQIGVDPDLAVVICDLLPPVARLLDHLDGSLTRDLLLAGAGPSAPDARVLLEELDRAGVLADGRRSWTASGPISRARLGPDLAATALHHRSTDTAARCLDARSAAMVEIHGGGRVGGAVGRLLAASGVGTVVVRDAGCVRSCDLLPGGWEPDSLGRARSQVLRGDDDGRPPDLAVLCPVGPAEPDGGRVDALCAAGTAHLVARVRENTGLVGPLVLPALRPDLPCLGCLEAHRAEADPDWPRLAQQLASSRPRTDDACDATLATTVVGIAARQALAWLERDRTDPTCVPAEVATGTMGATLEIRLGSWRARRRPWAVHPGCHTGHG